MNNSTGDIVKVFQDSRVIPVFYHGNIDVCKRVIEACYKGGTRVFEYVNRGENAIENFPVLMEFVKQNYSDMILGTGTILDIQQARQFITAGSGFIVAPNLDEEVGAECKNQNIPWIPGCGTLSEIARAEKLGAGIIKVFPGSVLGAEFVKAVLGPMPWLKLMPTGGVEPTERNLHAWFSAGVTCVGMGSQLIKKEMIENNQYNELTELVKNVLVSCQC